MINHKKNLKDEGLADIKIDPDVLAKELAVELEVDPLEEIDEDTLSRDNLDENVSSEIIGPFTLFYYSCI